MRALLCVLLLASACKTDKKSTPSESATPTEHAQGGTASSAPALPQQPSGGTGSGIQVTQDWNDPAIRAEWDEKREERRKKMEAELDTNHDGVVSPEEHAQRVKPMLERLDQNGDGKLTPDELAASDRRMGFDDPASLDTNKDGEISLLELDAAVTARREQMREKWRGRRGSGLGSGD